MASEDFNSASSLSQVSGATAQQAFFGAIRFGNLPLVEDILVRHPDAVTWRELRNDIQSFDTYGLHVAAERGKDAIVRTLVEAGAKVDAKDAEGRSPLMYAVFFDKLDVAAYLLERQANPNHMDGGDAPALFRAAKSGNLNAIELLLKHGARLNAQKNGENALFYALKSTQPCPEVFPFLIRQGIRYDAVNEDGKTVLEVATAERHPMASLIAQCIADREAWLAKQAKAEQAREIETICSGTERPISVSRPLTLKLPGI
ncbi:MAG: ankyrin repeat domain-containing protein [Alphaproteobacteria bacterium]